MSDRELLEMSAKAAGIFVTKEQFEKDCTSPWDPEWEILEYDGEAKSIAGWETIYSYNGELSGWGVRAWSPLTDDSEALRLAATLRLKIIPGKYKGDGCTVEAQRDGIAGCTAFRDDPSEQMRYAIVHVAAEIGKAMP